MGVGRESSTMSAFGMASAGSAVTESIPLGYVDSKMSRNPGSSSSGKSDERILEIRDSFMSSPVTLMPDLAKESAVGRPIRPIPTTQTRNRPVRRRARMSFS